MILPFTREARRRRRLKDWLALAAKVRAYRWDVLPESSLAELDAATGAVHGAIESGGEGTAELERLDAVLRRVGGDWYPRRWINENVEMVLVAAILAIGVRTYFLHPFKIPTNSMYPTYNGLTHESFTSTESAPGPIAGAFRTIAFGARQVRVEAPADGELVLPLFGPGDRRPALAGSIRFDVVKGREWLVLPSSLREYRLLVGGREVVLRVPLDFNLDEVVREQFGNGGPRVFPGARETLVGGRAALATGVTLRAGQTVLAFDILSGDALFVDRMSYHFVRPEAGDPFVFRTNAIPAMTARNGGVPVDKFYIKRLAGEPGDTLAVEGTTLLRNGAPADGAEAFEANARTGDEYDGYVASGRLAPGLTVTLGKDEYFAMGDNSDNSEDSRSWGTVPARSVIGRAIFIYYPFTKRWGLAR